MNKNKNIKRTSKSMVRSKQTPSLPPRKTALYCAESRFCLVGRVLVWYHYATACAQSNMTVMSANGTYKHDFLIERPGRQSVPTTAHMYRKWHPRGSDYTLELHYGTLSTPFSTRGFRTRPILAAARSPAVRPPLSRKARISRLAICLAFRSPTPA